MPKPQYKQRQSRQRDEFRTERKTAVKQFDFGRPTGLKL